MEDKAGLGERGGGHSAMCGNVDGVNGEEGRFAFDCIQEQDHCGPGSLPCDGKGEGKAREF